MTTSKNTQWSIAFVDTNRLDQGLWQYVFEETANPDIMTVHLQNCLPGMTNWQLLSSPKLTRARARTHWQETVAHITQDRFHVLGVELNVPVEMSMTLETMVLPPDGRARLTPTGGTLTDYRHADEVTRWDRVDLIRMVAVEYSDCYGRPKPTS